MKKILLMSDSPTLHTGFGKVLKKIVLFLSENTDWEIKVIGWFDKTTEKEKEILPFEIIPTDKSDQEDIYGMKTFDKVVVDFEPTIVFAMGDEWMVRYTAQSPLRNAYYLVMYCPIDGGPVPAEWVHTFKQANTFVTYGDFGKKMVESRDKEINVSTIPHGVDLSTYKKMDVQRPDIFDDDHFLIGVVARNQPRKQYPRLFKMLSLFLQPWLKCRDCGVTVITNQDEDCPNCKSKNILSGKGKDDVRVYIHCSLDDFSGWDIPELIERFGLVNKIAYPNNVTISKGMPERELAKYYNMFDVFTLPTQGEGFGLPILEAMACGIPTVVTNYSGHLDFCGDVSELITVSEFVTEPRTNIERAIVDIDDYLMRMDKLYYEADIFKEKWSDVLKGKFGVDCSKWVCGKELREKMSNDAMERAEMYEWKSILPVWLELFEKVFSIREDKQ